VAGKQPDASYCFENEKEIPDLAIEVVFSSGGVADLKKYQTLNVKEVWFWQQNQLKIYWLTDASYVLKSQSYVLNQLDSNLLDRFIQRGFNEDQLTIEAEFIEELER
jgi:Uma2 family endonuclease